MYGRKIKRSYYGQWSIICCTRYRRNYKGFGKVYIAGKYVTDTAEGTDATATTSTITSGTAYGTYSSSGSNGASHSGGA